MRYMVVLFRTIREEKKYRSSNAHENNKIEK